MQYSRADLGAASGRSTVHHSSLTNDQSTLKMQYFICCLLVTSTRRCHINSNNSKPANARLGNVKHPSVVNNCDVRTVTCLQRIEHLVGMMMLVSVITRQHQVTIASMINNVSRHCKLHLVRANCKRKLYLANHGRSGTTCVIILNLCLIPASPSSTSNPAQCNRTQAAPQPNLG